MSQLSFKEIYDACVAWSKVGVLVQDGFGEEGSNCACPLVALGFAKGSDCRVGEGFHVRKIMERMERALGVDEHYLQSFYLGFDNVDLDLFQVTHISTKEEFKPVESAFELGHEIRRALEADGLVIQEV